jgi:hypothetical protein
MTPLPQLSLLPESPQVELLILLSFTSLLLCMAVHYSPGLKYYNITIQA